MFNNCQFLSVHQSLNRSSYFSCFREDAMEVNAEQEESYVANFESEYINSCKCTDESYKNCQPDTVAGSYFIRTIKRQKKKKKLLEEKFVSKYFFSLMSG